MSFAMASSAITLAARSNNLECKKNTSPGYASRPGGRLNNKDTSRYATACLERSSYIIKAGLPVSLKYSPIAAHENGAYTCIGAGPDALAATIVVYAKAPLSSNVCAMAATVDAF